jgi:hypothetical protein
MQVQVRLNLERPKRPVIYDTGCSITLIDRSIIADEAEGVLIKQLKDPIIVRGLSTQRHPSLEYVLIDMYIKAAKDGKDVIVHIRWEMRVVDGLTPGILIGMDIIMPELIGFDPTNSILTFNKHGGATAKVTCVAPRRPRPRIRTTKRTVIPALTVQQVEVSMTGEPLQGEDCIFVPQYNKATKALEETGGTYALLAKANFTQVLVRNDSDSPFILPRHTYVGYVESPQDGEVYRVTPDAHELAVARSEVVRPCAMALLVASDENTTVTPNGIMIYAVTEDERRALVDLVTEFNDVFTEKPGCANADPMRIPLKDGWQDKKVNAKLYPLSKPDRQAVDEVFDKLHAQKRMTWSNQATPFGSPVFVVRRNMPDGTKGSKGCGRCCRGGIQS